MGSMGIKTMMTSAMVIAAVVMFSGQAVLAGSGCGSCGYGKADTAQKAEKTGNYKDKKQDKSGQDVVDIAASKAQFSTLVAAVKAAGLVDTLKSDGPFTVFAPTNDAFAALPDGTLETLLKPENRDQLVQILTYHVVPGKVTAEQVVKLDEATTVQGQPVTIKTKDGKVMINNARVIATDVMGSNGVIHVIDAVILPPAKQTASAK